MIKRFVRFSFLVFALLGVGLAYYAVSPMVTHDSAGEFSIPAGATLKSVAYRLKAQGVIDYPVAFIALGRLLGKAGQLKAGGYSLGKALTPYQLLIKITEGETVLAKVTVIEGWSFAQMRAALGEQSRLRHDSKDMDDRAILEAIGAEESHPEGLFFPDTYYFDVGESDLNIYKRAYHTLKRKLDAAWQARTDGLPYSTPYQALTMASIIEKETGAPDERPLIAAVFINRLRIGMRLQTDPTVIYGLGPRFDGNLRKVDLQTDTPYNTYTRAGLPPTPIALPSEAAIRAAVQPETSKVLYFVAKGGGRHQFSRSLDEHNRAVNRYQRGGG